jgi:hypothetical protein
MEFRNVDFCGGGEPGEKPSKLGRESTTNSSTKSPIKCDFTTGSPFKNKVKNKIKTMLFIFFVV